MYNPLITFVLKVMSSKSAQKQINLILIRLEMDLQFDI